ncbi:hypothetical protein CMV_019156 [Castanea mollissima]|uniref:Uncharacterized protein n=1 Tax=Castanea mollissima TaxID=60419 RepID=A0A8J4QZB2_9ROSI|nr:hypothetical protein CMV_019156 [Castanea mollissima]
MLHNRLWPANPTQSNRIHYVHGVHCCCTTKLFIKYKISFYSQMQQFDCDGLGKTLFDILKLVVDVKMIKVNLEALPYQYQTNRFSPNKKVSDKNVEHICSF